jgi:hypothetical protein
MHCSTDNAQSALASLHVFRHVHALVPMAKQLILAGALDIWWPPQHQEVRQVVDRHAVGERPVEGLSIEDVDGAVGGPRRQHIRWIQVPVQKGILVCEDQRRRN